MATYDIYADEMYNFVCMLREQLKLTDFNLVLPILNSLRKDKTDPNGKKAAPRAFRQICQTLTDMQCFGVILQFMNGVFKNWKDYDLDCIRDALSQITLSQGYTLDMLCRDYFLAVRKALSSPDDEPQTLEDIDLYRDDLDQYFHLSFDSGYHVCVKNPKVIAQKVYGIDLDGKEITITDIDELVKRIRLRTEAKYRAKQAVVDQQNERIRQTNQRLRQKGADIQEPYVADLEWSVFEQDLGIPGGLLPAFCACEVRGKRDVCYYILEKFVLPYLAQVPWRQENRPEIPCLAVITAVYSDFMQSLLCGGLPHTVDSDLHPRYVEEVFLKEALGKGDPALFAYAGKSVTDYCAAHRELAVSWAEVLHNGGELLARILREHLYSFHLAVAPYMLYFAGEQERAAEFLLSHYNDLRSIDKRKPIVLTVLIRSILSATRPETANTLYGIYSYEMDRSRREKPRMVAHIRGMLQVAEDAKAVIAQSGGKVVETGVCWEELLFGDGQINGMLARGWAAVRGGNVPNLEDYRHLVRTVDGLCFSGGIHLGILGLPPQDGYDKLDFSLPRPLVLRGQGLLEQVQEAKHFYSSMLQEQTRRDIHIYLQSHIYKLQQQLITDSLTRVTKLKQELSGKEDEEQTLKAIQEIAEELNNMLLSTTLGRDDASRRVHDLMNTFARTCLDPADDPDLLQKVPAIRDDINNYLVTSEVVFRMLEGKRDSTMDFSAALISLTKALELVMNFIYSRMNVSNYSTLDPGIRKEVLDKNGNPKASLTMGPCIMLLKDARYINVAPSFNTTTLLEQNAYSDPHYARWGGDTVLDISKLSKFSSIPIHINGYSHGAPTEEVMHFGTSDTFNRRLLAKALEYIKDNYRNPAAHKDILGIDKVRSCHQLLVEGEYLLWILLSIIR